MSDTAKPIDDTVVLVGSDPPAEDRPNSILRNEALSALNLCFLVTTVGGAIAEVLGSPTAAVAAMLGFLAYGFLFRKSVPNIERFADSAYYQGFILTLFALILALTGKGAHTLTSDGIIEKFGLAIWTTFVGMGGRIFIIQFLTTAQDEGEAVRDSISAYASRLNEEIGQTLRDFQAFRALIISSATNVSQQLAEEAKATRSATTDSVKEAMALQLKAIQKSSAKLDSAMEQVASRISTLEIPAEVVSEQIRKVADLMGQDLTRVRVELETQCNEYATILKSNADILVGSGKDLDQLRVSLTEVNRIIGDASTTTSASLAATLENLAASAQAVQGVEKLGQTSASLADKLTSLSQAFEQKSMSSAAEMERLARETTGAATQTRSQLAAISEAMSESAQRLTTVIREVRQSDDERR